MCRSGTSTATETGSAVARRGACHCAGPDRCRRARVARRLGVSCRSSAPGRVEARYAAESALDRAVLELQGISSWDDVLGGRRDVWTHGGKAAVGGAGTDVDLGAETARLQARTDPGPDHGGNTPQWRPFLWAPFGHLVPAPADLERRSSSLPGWRTMRRRGTGTRAMTATSPCGCTRPPSAPATPGTGWRPWSPGRGRPAGRYGGWSGGRARPRTDESAAVGPISRMRPWCVRPRGVGRQIGG